MNFTQRVEAHNAAVLGQLPPGTAAGLLQVCRPEQWQDLAVAVAGFAGALALGCGLLELLNTRRRAQLPPRAAAERRGQILHLREIADSVGPGFGRIVALCYSLFVIFIPYLLRCWCVYF